MQRKFSQDKRVSNFGTLEFYEFLCTIYNNNNNNADPAPNIGTTAKIKINITSMKLYLNQ